MTLHEPTTFATDLALGALTATLGVRLLRRARAGSSRPMRLWGAAFLTSAAAACAGGFYHGFLPVLGAIQASALWKATTLLVGATSFFLVGSAADATFSARAARTWIVAAGIKAVVYAAWMAAHDEYRYVIYDYGSAMLAVAALQAVRLLRGPADAGAGWILAGIAVSFAAAAVQHGRLALHALFNHNDLYHVIQMGAVWFLYRGGRELQPRPGAPRSPMPPPPSGFTMGR